MSTRFVDAWRREASRAFDLRGNSTAGHTVPVVFWGTRREVYANANLSVYSAQTCNARCAFCVEELRPASRGRALAGQKRVERDDTAYFDALENVLRTVRPLDPSVSVTGGEPSKDPRLPRILRTLARHGVRKRTLTTNGSGLLDVVEGRAVVDWVTATGLRHLNISRAHPDHQRNAALMRYDEGLDVAALDEVVRRAHAGGTRARLSCVLLDGAIDSLDGILAYVAFARARGVDNVIFRRLMDVDRQTVERNHVVRYCDRRRVPLAPLLDAVSAHGGFTFVRQIVGYYYYVEVWEHDGVTVVFEEADLGQLEATKRTLPDVIHELVFHPDARLASTWQPWDGVLGPAVPVAAEILEAP